MSDVKSRLTVTWLDAKREPRVAPNPLYPKGKDVDVSAGAARSCSTPLPYPAPRCGVYMIECEDCGLRVGVTTAGRADDPRSVKIACLLAPSTRH